MLDILIRWSIWDFKCILSDERKDVHVFMKQLKSDPWFQTEEEEGKMEDSYGQFKILDISNRFKMLDISNRFEIWDFKCILNVEMWLQICTASNPPSLVWELQQFRTLCANVWSNEKVISGFRQKWRKVTWRTPMKTRGGRECSWGRPTPRTSRWSRWRAWLWQQHQFTLLRYGASRRSPCQLCLCQTDDWIGAGNGFFHKYLGTLIWSNAWITIDN